MAEAKLNREYALRIIGVGAMMFGMCAWSLYDGRVAWPEHNRSLERVRPELLATNLTVEAWLAQDDEGSTLLASVFAKAGRKVPGKLVKKIGELRLPRNVTDSAERNAEQAKQLRALFESDVYSPHDLATQTVQAVITFLAGVWAWLLIGLKVGRRFAADETGLHGSGFGSGTVAYSSIAEIDWTKWDDKGIVRMTLKDGRRVVLDGWHFAGVTGIVDAIRRFRPDLDAKPKAEPNG